MRNNVKIDCICFSYESEIMTKINLNGHTSTGTVGTDQMSFPKKCLLVDFYNILGNSQKWGAIFSPHQKRL